MRDLHSRTRNRSRLVGAIVSAGAMILAIGCENGGVANPTAPSAASTTAATSAPTSFDALARDRGSGHGPHHGCRRHGLVRHLHGAT